MKLNKLFLGLVCASAAFIASCSDDKDYEWAPLTGGNQVYFSNTLPSSINLSKSATTFTVPVSRVDSTSAASYTIAVDADQLFVTAPTSVSFNAGQAVADLVLTYNPDTLAYDLFRTIKLTITDEANTNDYGYKTYSFKAGIPSPYVSMGKGQMTDNFWFEATAKVTIMQNSENKNIFRIMSPFEGLASAAGAGLDGNQEPYIQLTLLQPGDVFYGVTITENGLVGYEDLNTGYYHSSYEADVYMLFPGRMTKYAGEEFFLHNRVLEWQANGLPGRVQLAPYFYMFGVGGWDNTQADGVVTIDFPGYEPKDYSVENELLGVLTSTDGVPSIAFNATLGADANDVRGVVVSADADMNAAAEAVVKGEMESTPVANGYNFVSIPDGLTGKLSLLLVVVDGGEMKEGYIYDFEYWGGGANPWEPQGIGNYTYSIFFTDEDGNPVVDPGLELQYNAADDAYRITHWGYNVDFSFKWDKSTNLVTVPNQYCGYTHSSYGDVYVGEADALNPDWGLGQSYYEPETLTFHFHVAYFVSAGYFGKGEETFTLTPAQARALGLDKAQKPSVNTSLKPVKKTTAKKMVEKML